VPIVSFFALRGRCSSCKTKISWQYPLVELGTGLIFMTLSPLYWPIFCLFMVITVYDLRHKIIPDSLVYTGIALALAHRALVGGSAFDWLVGPILFALFAFGWWVSKGRALGFGDAKLSLAVGLLLGGYLALSALAMAFWIGTAVTLPFVIRGYLSQKKSLTIKSEIPFAPFIMLGAWVSLLFDLDIFHVLSF
jgi:leader peptidase (prepilin peptidase) / N-methyltransferase